MTPDRIERYLRRLRGELATRLVPPGRILAELREHLTDARDEGVRQGLSAEAAEQRALAKLGPPRDVARRFAAGRSPLDRLLAAACVVTVAAVAFLTLSVVVLQPPGGPGSGWAALATLLCAQSFLTLFVVLARPSGPWPRLLSSAGGAAILWLGASWVRASLVAPHFEGYALLLGSIVAVQGAITVLHPLFRRGLQPR